MKMMKPGGPKIHGVSVAKVRSWWNRRFAKYTMKWNALSDERKMKVVQAYLRGYEFGFKSLVTEEE